MMADFANSAAPHARTAYSANSAGTPPRLRIPRILREPPPRLRIPRILREPRPDCVFREFCGNPDKVNVFNVI